MCKVSVIVPCYNYGRFLSKCITSILCQSIKDFEIIVINDCSTDETTEVLTQFRENPKIKIIHHKSNKGFPKSVNEGVDLTEGEYITMISADDYLMNNSALAILSGVMDIHPEVGFVHSAYYLVDTVRNRKFMIPPPFKKDCILKGRSEFYRLLMRKYWIADCAVIIRKEYYKKVGGRDENITNCCDWDLWLKLSFRWDVGYIASPLGVMQLHGSNMHENFVRSGKAYKESIYILDKVFNEFELTNEERKLKDKAYALAHLQHGFSRYTTSVLEFRNYFSKAIKLYYPLIFSPKVVFTYLKSLLGNTVLHKARLVKSKIIHM